MVVENLTALNVSQNITHPGLIGAPVEYVKQELLPRMYDFFLAPSDHPEMLWTLGPMLVALVLMQLYFGRNKDEDLGWNTAFGNSVALIFISVSLLRGLFILTGYTDFMVFAESMATFADPKILVILFLFGYGIFLSMLSFFHWIPARLAFFMMNGISINATAYVGIVLVNSDNVPLDLTTVFSGVLIFIIAYVAFMMVRFFVPASLNSRINLLKRKKTILDAKVRILEKKVRNAKTDAKKAKFTSKAKKQELLSRATQKAIEELKREL